MLASGVAFLLLSTMPTSPLSRSAGRVLPWMLVGLVALVAAYFAVVLNWSYSVGERAGWVQKFSKKGWLCKTWEGEISLISMPGAAPEKFEFTVTDDAVADQINRQMGQRVALHYEQRVGLPTSCFGDTRYFVTSVVRVAEVPLGLGITVPSPTVPMPVPGAPVAPASPAGTAPAVPTAPVPGLPASAPLLPAEPPAQAPATRP